MDNHADQGTITEADQAAGVDAVEELAGFVGGDNKRWASAGLAATAAHANTKPPSWDRSGNEVLPHIR
jgi:hypothetical protein